MVDTEYENLKNQILTQVRQNPGNFETLRREIITESHLKAWMELFPFDHQKVFDELQMSVPMAITWIQNSNVFYSRTICSLLKDSPKYYRHIQQRLRVLGKTAIPDLENHPYLEWLLADPKQAHYMIETNQDYVQLFLNSYKLRYVINSLKAYNDLAATGVFGSHPVKKKIMLGYFRLDKFDPDDFKGVDTECIERFFSDIANNWPIEEMRPVLISYAKFLHSQLKESDEPEATWSQLLPFAAWEYPLNNEEITSVCYFYSMLRVELRALNDQEFIVEMELDPYEVKLNLVNAWNQMFHKKYIDQYQS